MGRLGLSELEWEAQAVFRTSRRGAEEACAKTRAKHTKQRVSEVLRLEEGENLWGFIVWKP